MTNTRRARVGALLLCCSVGLLGAQTALPGRPDPVAALPDGLYALIETVRGPIVLELYADEAPFAVASFVGLAEGSFTKDGRPYYDGVSFHRVEPGFVIQGGDPEGSGRGGPGYRWNDEPVKAEYTVGAVAMANAGPNTNGSQFFICIDDCTRKLDKLYNLFGYVTQGVDVAQAIGVGDTIDTVEVTERPAA